MKGLFLSIAAVLLSCSLAAQEYLPAWQDGYFDIHEIATGEGDAHFMIFPDGTTMLCDAGDRHGMVRSDGSKKDFPNFPDKTKRSGQWIADYILEFSKGLKHPSTVDYFWLTHFHEDHFGYAAAMLPGTKGYGLSGVTLVGEQITFNKIVDRDYPDYSYPSREFLFAESEGFMPEYEKYVSYQVEHNGTVGEKFKIGSKKQFALKNNPKPYKNSFYVWNVASNGYLTTGSGKRRMSDEDPNSFDENMLSSVAVFKYGKFSYFQGGDLTGGMYGVGNRNVTERDFESQVADVIGQVTVMSANHHGWKDCCNSYFLWKLAPQAIIFNATDNNQPWCATVQRCADPQLPFQPKLYITTQSSKAQLGELWNHFAAPDGHIVIRVYPEGTSYQIFVLNSHSGKYEVIYKSGEISLK